jgi:Skp family chaperone for outer membrane proteins
VLDVRTICTATLVAILFSLGLAASVASAQTGTNVAVVDIPYIFKNFTRFKHAMDDIKKDVDSFRDYMTEKQKQLRTEAEKLQLYRSGTKEYKEVEEGIARLRMEVELERGKRQKEIMEREAQVYFNAYREVEAAVGRFASERRIGLVLHHNGEDMDPTQRDSIMQGINRIVVYQDRLDITGMILDQLERGTPPTPTATRPVIPGRPANH